MQDAGKIPGQGEGKRERKGGTILMATLTLFRRERAEMTLEKAPLPITEIFS